MKVPPPVLRFAALSLVLCASAAYSATYYSDPAKGSDTNDGSANAPWPGLDVLASSTQFAGLKDGDTLLLRSGNHGDVKISGDFSQPLTIAAEPGQKPQLSRLEVLKGSNIHLRGLSVSPSFGSSPYKGNIVTLAERGEGTGIVLEDCFVFTELDSSAWTAEQWMATGHGISAGRNGKNITVRNNYILNTRFALTMASPDSTCEGNVIENFSGDGIRALRDGVTVAYNLVKNGYVGPAEGDQNHDDLMQCFQFNASGTPIKNLTIRGNILIGNEKDDQPLKHTPQAIGFFDGPLIDFVVEDNVIRTDHYHGISLYDAVNCKITNNVVIANTDQKMKPWIMLNTKKRGGSNGNTVKDNYAEKFNLKADTTVTEENNVVVDEGTYEKVLAEREKEISTKFGATHSTSGMARFSSKK